MSHYPCVEFDDYSESSTAEVDLDEQDPLVAPSGDEDQGGGFDRDDQLQTFLGPTPAWDLFQHLVGEAILDEILERGRRVAAPTSLREIRSAWEEWRNADDESQRREEADGSDEGVLRPSPSWRQCAAGQGRSLLDALADLEIEITARILADGNTGGGTRKGESGPAIRTYALPLTGTRRIRAADVLPETFLHWPVSGTRSEICHGYSNCCCCEHCRKRESRAYRITASWETFSHVAALVKEEMPRVLGEELRGGARQRGEQVAMRVRHPEGLYRYDFRRRQSGPGAAGADIEAIADWLTGRLVRHGGRCWLIGERERRVQDYAPITQRRGGPAPRNQLPLLNDLLDRLHDLAEAGAYKRSIADVLEVNENTVRRLLKRPRPHTEPDQRLSATVEEAVSP